jgi:hypothetical protein
MYAFTMDVCILQEKARALVISGGKELETPIDTIHRLQLDGKNGISKTGRYLNWVGISLNLINVR